MEFSRKSSYKASSKSTTLKTQMTFITRLRDLFADTIQEFMEAELETHLGYAPRYQKQKTSNSRNGKSAAKTVTTELGETKSAHPDREGLLILRSSKSTKMTSRGWRGRSSPCMPKGCQQGHPGALQPLSTCGAFPTLVSNITDRILPRIQEWQNLAAPRNVCCCIHGRYILQGTP